MLKTAVIAALALASSPSFAEKPVSSFCQMVRNARTSIGDEKAAEDAARAKGVPEATIQAAKRCLKT